MRELTDNQKKKLSDFLKESVRASEITARLDRIKPTIIKMVRVRGGKLEHDGLNVAVEESATYQYSETVKRAEKQLNALRKEERETGVAIRNATEKLVIRGKHK